MNKWLVFVVGSMELLYMHQRNFIVEMTNVTVELNRSWVDVSSSIDRVNNKTVLDVKLTVHKDIAMIWVNKLIHFWSSESMICPKYIFQARSTLVFLSPDMDERIEMFNTTSNVCQFLANKRRGSCVKKIFDNIARNGFVFEECPIKAV